MRMPVSMTVNGKAVSAEIDARTLLVEFLREHLRLTGTHVGCDTGHCGACTVHVDGRAASSRATARRRRRRARIADDRRRSLRDGDAAPDAGRVPGASRPAVRLLHAGHVMNAIDIAQKHPNPSEEKIRSELDGNLCRCTGYHNIVKAVQAGAEAMK